MFKLKEYPDDYWKNQSKGWLRFKKRYKRKSNKAIRQRSKKFELDEYIPNNYKKYNGHEIEW